MRINNQKAPLFGSFASTFLPMKKREEIIDVEEQVRQFKAKGSNYLATIGNSELGINQSPPKPKEQKVGP